jgi:glycosyltransferase involved in cell wall biosynthesis
VKQKIAILCPYPLQQAPSQRFRFEQYLEFLSENNLEISVFPFLNQGAWEIFYHQGKPFQKSIALILGMFRRGFLMFNLLSFPIIFIHREAAPMGPPVFEWILCKVFKKQVIYDFDDAIWLPNYSKQHEKFHRLKAYWKIKHIVRWANTVVVGNSFLAEYALRFNGNVTIIPTTIDLRFHRKPTAICENHPLVIGWTGSHTTINYLLEIADSLEILASKHHFVFRVISNLPPDFDLPNVDFVKWNQATEMQDLSSFDIGVMPLTDDEWSKGKCGFKALQYMSLGIPTVASDVGVNANIIEDGKNGFLIHTKEDWVIRLTELLTNPVLRSRLGSASKDTVKMEFSVEANQHKYLKLFQK